MNIWDFANAHPYAWAITSIVTIMCTYSMVAVAAKALKAWAKKCNHPVCEHPCHYVEIDDEDAGAP
jgi:hypothetical protein